MACLIETYSRVRTTEKTKNNKYITKYYKQKMLIRDRIYLHTKQAC